MEEEWKVIEKNENYEISSIGRVRRKSNGRVKVPELSRTGYLTIRLSYGIQGKGTHYNIHRLVAEAFLENRENYPCVNHIDGNKMNNKIDNLEWCSYSYNNKHAYDNGLHRPYKQVITEENMREIEHLSENGMKVKDIATMYGVTESALYWLNRKGKIHLSIKRRKRRSDKA